MTDRQLRNFWAKVDKTESCWLWTGALDRQRHGYGVFGTGKDRVKAHRFTYQLALGAVPSGLVLDHLCNNTRCVNPEHLKAVTQRENVLRSAGITAAQARQTHCKRGHALSGANLFIKGDGRECRECKRMHARESARRCRALESKEP
jgi:hypothetical protein